MSSIIEGYEYDIFISYRQKDNKHDGWVTEFVDNLKGELESTFKEEVSVYFDINPHDGLLETHDVDASLKEKLKCLIFIPIISRTYCDPKSFAWEHEFKAFVEQASKDQFGLKVKLQGGNVANRVLPIQIYELEADDRKLIEDELGGFMRGIEFIYKEPGVNKPLKPDDDEKMNLNKTKYSYQVNKVANAVKEIITSLKRLGQPQVNELIESDGAKSGIQKNSKFKIVITSVSILLLIIIGLIIIPKLFKSSEPLEKTIAVLPFRNLSNDTTKFVDGFMEELLNNLQKVKSFTVRSRTSSDQYRDTKKSIASIGEELNANYLIQGSVGREGNKRKIWVQLIEPKTDKQIWSGEYLKEMTIEQIFSLQSEIAKEIATELNIVLSSEEVREIEKRPTENIEAYNYYLQGNYYYWKSYASQDYESAIKLYEEAVDLDPNFAMAYARIGISLLAKYWFYEDRNENILVKSKYVIERAFEIDPDLPEAHVALGYFYYWGYLKYPQALEELEKALKKQPGNSEAFYVAGSVYRRAGNFEKSKEYYLKALEFDPRSSRIAFNTGQTFDLLREYSTAQNYYNTAIMLQPDWVYPYHELSRLHLRWSGDTKKARETIENGIQFNQANAFDSINIETIILINLYEGRYDEVIKELSAYKFDVFQTQYYYRPKSLYYAANYTLLNKPDLAHIYYDSARIFLEEKLKYLPEDPRLYSSLGIAYAGLGNEKKALNASQKAVKILPVEKEAWKGVYLIEDLAYTYIILGKYPEALEKIEYLLSIPGVLSTKILELDPRWAPLKDHPEFRKILEKYTIL